MKNLIIESGMTLNQFAAFYEIPYNTVRQWYNEERKAPEWVKKLIEKAANGKQLEINENEYEMYEFYNKEGRVYRSFNNGEYEEWHKKRLEEWNNKEFTKMRVSKVRLIAEYTL